jgi:hypothetical protein
LYPELSCVERAIRFSDMWPNFHLDTHQERNLVSKIQIESKSVSTPASVALPLEDFVIDASASQAMDGDSVGGVPSPAITPLILPSRDSSSLPAQPETHSSPPPTTPVAAVMDADFVTPTRWSGRYGAAADGATVTDEDSMHRAMRRKTELNLDYFGIVTPSKAKYFLSFSTPDISSKLNRVGVRIGSSKKEIVVSSNVLRRMEVDRLTVTPKVSTFSNTTYVDNEEAIATTDGQLLSQLIGEVSDVIMDEARLSSLYELKASGRKSRSCSSKKGKKPRKRVKFPLQQLFPDEWHVLK